MRRPNKKALNSVRALIVMLSVLVVAAPTALAYRESSSPAYYWYVDANTGGDPFWYHNSVPLVIEINGDSSDWQVFNVDDRIDIISNAYSIATIAIPSGLAEAYTESTLQVSGPIATVTTTAFHSDSDTTNVEVDNTMIPETVSITSLLLTNPGTYTIVMSSYAAVSDPDRPDTLPDLVADETADALLNFIVVGPSGLGDCISTLIHAVCDGLIGRPRAECVNERLSYCHETLGD